METLCLVLYTYDIGMYYVGIKSINNWSRPKPEHVGSSNLAISKKDKTK